MIELIETIPEPDDGVQVTVEVFKTKTDNFILEISTDNYITSMMLPKDQYEKLLDYMKGFLK